MGRGVRALGLAFGGLLVAALGLALAEPVAQAEGAGPTPLVRVAQKQKTKKRVRGKRGAPPCRDSRSACGIASNRTRASSSRVSRIVPIRRRALQRLDPP